MSTIDTAERLPQGRQKKSTLAIIRPRYKRKACILAEEIF